VLIRNLVKYSPPQARLIYSSTFSVYGDPRRNAYIRWRSTYGSTKLASEKTATSTAAGAGKELFVFRLGHVCGDLQNITALIQDRIRDDVVILPDMAQISNCVYTATIVDAIMKIAAGFEKPGIYDLMNCPQWTWREVFEFEASRIGHPLRFASPSDSSHHRRSGQFLSQRLNQLMKMLRSTPLARQLGGRLASRLPRRLNERLHAAWSLSRARAEIGELSRAQVPEEFLTWIASARDFLPSLERTSNLLQSPLFQIAERDPAIEFPPDLPPAAIPV
jgi:nucleoside-diphosphate-sugar epimerase